METFLYLCGVLTKGSVIEHISWPNQFHLFSKLVCLFGVLIKDEIFLTFIKELSFIR